MAADDEFPRGWQLSVSFVNGQQMIVDIPAIVGFAHVITEVSAVVSATGTATASGGIQTSIFDQSIPTQVLFLMWNSLAGGANSVDAASWSGKVRFPEGHAVRVQHSLVLPASWNGIMNVFGYSE